MVMELVGLEKKKKGIVPKLNVEILAAVWRYIGIRKAANRDLVFVLSELFARSGFNSNAFTFNSSPLLFPSLAVAPPHHGLNDQYNSTVLLLLLATSNCSWCQVPNSHTK